MESKRQNREATVEDGVSGVITVVMEGRMDSGHFLEDGMARTYWLISRLRRMKERRVKDDSVFPHLSNCMNYTSGSQTFSVHNTLSISVNFSQYPLSQKKLTVVFIYYLSPRNLINTCVTFLLLYDCIFMLKQIYIYVET